MHDDGELLEQEHRAEGTRVRALVSAALAAELAPFAPTPPRPLTRWRVDHVNVINGAQQR